MCLTATVLPNIIHNFKYKRFKKSGCNVKEIGKLGFVTNVQLNFCKIKSWKKNKYNSSVYLKNEVSMNQA